MFRCHPIFSAHQSTPFGVTWLRQPGSQEGTSTHDLLFFVMFENPTFLLRCLYLFYPEKGSAVSLPRRLVDREVQLCLPTRKSLSTVELDVRKNATS